MFLAKLNLQMKYFQDHQLKDFQDHQPGEMMLRGFWRWRDVWRLHRWRTGWVALPCSAWYIPEASRAVWVRWSSRTFTCLGVIEGRPELHSRTGDFTDHLDRLEFPRELVQIDVIQQPRWFDRLEFPDELIHSDVIQQPGRLDGLVFPGELFWSDVIQQPGRKY